MGSVTSYLNQRYAQSLALVDRESELPPWLQVEWATWVISNVWYTVSALGVVGQEYSSLKDFRRRLACRIRPRHGL